ncbi:MAG: enhanced serine sensitivity protein SseB [Lachnospiraceae bacterium]|nr:enhanced serine sensitivity protein SseB [Lachnospiraceae bacterium]
MGMFDKFLGKKEKDKPAEAKVDAQATAETEAETASESAKESVEAKGQEDAAAPEQEPAQKKKSLDNFRLKVLLKEVKENKTDTVTSMVFEEIVMKAKFVSPAIFEKKAENAGEDGGLFSEGTIVRMPMITSPEGKGFYAMFTDYDEFENWTAVKGTDTMILSFDDYAALMEKSEQAEGVVLNPFSDNLVLNRQTMDYLRIQKELKTKGVAKRKVAKDISVLVGEPKEYPRELVEAVKRYLPDVPQVNRVWVRLMMKNNVQSLLLVVDQTGDKEEIFKGIALAAKPYLNKMYLDMVSYQDEFGKKAVENSEPFYEK